ncbi:insulinase family protein [Haematospirillum sp. H1815]|uniref:M16 family metallopeptidase n=1 Tax=Haematospirillum sp. H1815 TaxID=2723108 RepID=UPI0014397FB6|nr:pitrilysin family protein [Haematospirillum sp. H1815]NKD76877.1 insulinase family protein [Haematospirillum sp. H1815]
MVLSKLFLQGLVVAAVAVLVLPSGSVRAQTALQTQIQASRIGIEAPKVYNASTFTLDNGLQVVVVENHRMPVVSHMVWYKVGAADEPPGQSGLAHLLEHMMFKGTDTLKPGEFSALVARNGGRENAFTSSDYTAYFQNIAVDRLPLVMKLEADRMRNLAFDEKEFLTERDVVIQERLMRTENEPDAQLYERASMALWVNHPYRNPIVGWMDELSALTRQNALDFYKKWYAPDNAILVISGDVTVDQVRNLADTYYGPLSRGPGVQRLRNRQPPPDAVVRVDMAHPNVTQLRWGRRYRVPGINTAPARQDTLALSVLSDILGGGQLGRLYRDLVIKRNLAVDAGASYSPLAVDDGVFDLYAIPRPGVSVADLEKAVDDVVQGLLRDGLTVAEVEDVKTRMQAGAIYARDSLQGPAYRIGMALSVGESLESVETWPQQIAGVGRDDVMTAARTWLRDQAAVTAVLKPGGKS